MSNIKDSKLIKSDLENTINFFKQQEKQPQTPQNPHLEEIVKNIHKTAYCIKLFSIKLDSNIALNKKIFVKGMLSDYITIMHLLINNFEISSELTLRRIIELFYNHIYYYDHPIEYIQLEQGKNEYTPIIELKKYVEKHPLIPNSKDDNIKIMNDNIFNHYHNISRTVHAKGSEHMALFDNIQQLKNSFAYISQFLIDINSISQAIIYILFKIHKDIPFTPVERSTLTSFLPREYRRKMTE
ncbi:hypothetical protein LRS06_14215 [Hymenobacter sp. J193]|uniref:hypothetical protein n=1 Tax=Hymenobacter sp. J193 TaxID=2898429 RepID=UPI002151FDC4|nr:hypothetical protein [Hymenobacter sp. J193]MCR5888900.1 hypothetical protein [Hymenobacter sp. J193]